jgi:hypothetical protein
MKALGKVLVGMYKFVDAWFDNNRVTSDLASEDALQSQLREALTMHGLKVDEGSKIGGGKLDLYVEDAILIENKFHSSPVLAADVAPAAGMQGRRYAISLGSQVVIVVAAHKVEPGKFPNKAECISVKSISRQDRNRAEVRFTVPFGAVVPSSEKPEQAAQGA